MDFIPNEQPLPPPCQKQLVYLKRFEGTCIQEQGNKSVCALCLLLLHQRISKTRAAARRLTARKHCTYIGCYMHMSKSQKQRFFVFFLRNMLAILERSRQHDHQSGSAVLKQSPLHWVLPVLDFIRGYCIQHRNFKCGIWHIASLSEMPGLCRAQEGTWRSHCHPCTLSGRCGVQWRHQLPPHGQQQLRMPQSPVMSQQCHVPPRVLSLHLYSPYLWGINLGRTSGMMGAPVEALQF